MQYVTGSHINKKFKDLVTHFSVVGLIINRGNFGRFSGLLWPPMEKGTNEF